MTSPEYRYLTFESLDEGAIVRIMLNRPEARNAQNRGLLVELAEAYARAEADDTVRVVILGAHGPTFSTGHDLGSAQGREDMQPGPNQHPSARVNGGTRAGAERLMLQEWHHFFETTRRWRNLRKITIAAVHGQVYAAGLMLMCGMEYFAHPWEFGPRKAKELLLTGDSIDADEAYRLGMVSKVFAPEQLPESALAFARRIAAVPTMAALLIKESVNQTVDTMGFHTALNACFTIHELNHAHWAWRHGADLPVAQPEDGISDWRSAPAIRPALKNHALAPDSVR